MSKAGASTGSARTGSADSARTGSPERHLDDATAEAYVLGALDAEAAAWVEAHSSACRACAERLRAEARLEEKLYELGAAAAEPAPAPPARTGWRRAARWAARSVLAASAAAALAFAFAQASVRGYPSFDIPPAFGPEASRAVTCLGVLDECEQAARARGLVVQYPPLGSVPRYEGPSPIPSATLARAPSPL